MFLGDSQGRQGVHGLWLLWPLHGLVTWFAKGGIGYSSKPSGFN